MSRRGGELPKTATQKSVELPGMPLEQLAEGLWALDRRRNDHMVVSVDIHEGLLRWAQGKVLTAHTLSIALHLIGVHTEPQTPAIRSGD